MKTDENFRNENKTLIHVYGTERSGSTMLDLMLGNAPDAFSCGEVSAWFRPYRKHHREIQCTCQDNPCLVWEKIKDTPEHDFHARLFQDLAVSFVVDSSKDICWLLDTQRWADIYGIRSVILLLWKKPVDLSYSFWKRGEDVSYWRSHFVKFYRWIFQARLPHISVNYNNLATAPKEVLEKICMTIGMPYFDGKERFWEKSHHYLFGSGGIRKQMNAKSSVIKYRQKFPAEFEEAWQGYKVQFEKDLEVQDIVFQLEARDVSVLERDRSNMSLANTDESARKILLPAWYYRKKITRWLRRYFPEKYDQEKHSGVEYVPKA